MMRILTICLIIYSQQIYATIIVVDQKSRVNSISQAVQLANRGDTILIKKGIYYINNVVLTNPVTIIGEDLPILHGSDKFELLTIRGKNISISGMEFSHSGYSGTTDMAGITIVDASYITIENNRFTQTYFGIHVANSHHFTIRKNELKGVTKSEQSSGNGIHLWKCSYALVENNNSSGHRDGIYFEFVTNSRIQRNLSHNNIR